VNSEDLYGSNQLTSFVHIPYPLVNTSSSPLRNPGPLRPAAWSKWLSNHPDRRYAQTLVDIIVYGARIGYTGIRKKNILRPERT
jgi:hypothetical protein